LYKTYVRDALERHMENITTAEARKHLAELLNRAAYGKERFVVTRHGKELVAIVPVEDLDLLRRVRQFVSRKEVEEALRDLETGGTVPWEALKSDLGL
jgi:prevent-host-death family protein